MYEQIKKEIESAARTNQKTAMFHFQVLANATELRAVDPAEFCRAVGAPKSFTIEFRKMTALAQLMRERGVRLA
jgi:hypothetical protein